MNLTFNNANKTEINVFQKIDKTSLYVVVGLGIILLATIVVIDLAAKRAQKRLKVSETGVPMKEEEEGARTKIQEEDEWKGI